MDDFCDEHDSAELLMMQIDFPEDASQAGGFLQKTIFEDFPISSSPLSPKVIEFGKFEGQKSGFVSSGELDRILKCQQPFKMKNENNVELFGVVCSIFTPLEDPVLFSALFAQRISWLEKRCLGNSLQFSGSTPKLSVDVATSQIAFYFAVLRYLAFKVTLSSNFSSDEIVNLVSLIHHIHIFIGKVSSLPEKALHFKTNCNSRAESNPSSFFHTVITAKWTVASCLHYLSSFDVTPSNKILPRFCQFIGSNWGREISIDNHTDSLSRSQLERLTRQVSIGLVHDLILLSEGLIKRFVQASHADSFSSLLKQKCFVCDCVKELWICTIKLMEERGSSSFWGKVSYMFESSTAHPSMSSNPEFEPNTLQLQWTLNELSLKQAFWILYNLVNLYKDMENYCELKQLDPSILSILEKILGRYADEVNSKGVCNEIETRSYFNVVRSISSMTKGSSINILLTMWEMMYLRLNENFRIGSKTLDGFAAIPHSYSDWLDRIDKIIGQSEPHEMNSFELFLAVLSIHLSDDGPKCAKVSVQFFGRVRVKLNPQSLGALDERGLFHLLSIFITLVKTRNDTNHIFNGLREILRLVPTNVSRSSVLFKGLCSLYACLVKKVSLDCNLMMPLIEKAFGLISSHMESVLAEGTHLNQVSVIQNYALLLGDPVCLSNDILISQPGIFHPCLIKYLEKKGQGEIILAFRNLVLCFMRYYKDSQYARMEQLTDQELEIKKNVDGNAKSVWRLILPLLKNFMCSSKLSGGPFSELAELAYGLSIWAFHCSSIFKSEWHNSSDQPPDFKVLFRTFALAHNIHPQVTCTYLRLFLHGELASSESQGSLLESWTRCSIVLQDHMQNNEVSSELRQTTEEIFKLNFFNKLAVVIEQSPSSNQDFFKTLVVAVGVYIHKNPSLYTTIEPNSDFILRTFLQLLQRPTDDEVLKIRFIKVASWIIKNWSGPLLYAENFRDGRVTKNFVGQILNLTFLRQEYYAQSLALSPSLKKTFRTTIPGLCQGLGRLLTLTTNESIKRHLRELFTIFFHRFEYNEMHPVAKVFQSDVPELIRAQIAYYQYFYEVVFLEAKRVKAKRSGLANYLNIVRTGLLGSSSLSETSVETFARHFLPPVMDVYTAFGHEEFHLTRSVEELTKVIFCYTSNERKTNPESRSLKALEGPEIRQMIRERMPNCITKNLFDFLTIISHLDPQFIQKSKEFLEETVLMVEKQRHQTPGTSHLSQLLKSLLQKSLVASG